MARFLLSPTAEHDIDSILIWSQEQFGTQGRQRYEALVMRAILDVADNPQRLGSRTRLELIETARTYHLKHSRNRVSIAIGRVRHPRHFILYRYLSEDLIEIGRIFHDRMDLSQHLPSDYRSSIDEEG